MNLTELLLTNTIPIYFIYGLAHFIMGLAVALEIGRGTQLRFARALPFLAAFGITHGINEWVEMFSMISAHIPTLVQEPRWAEMFKVAWKATSFVFLFLFGTRLLAQTATRSKRWLNALPFIALGVYLVTAFAMYLRAKPDGYPAPELTEMLTNYALGVPASIAAALALIAQRRSFLRDGMPQFGRDLIGAALAISWYCLLDQIIDNPAAVFPANILNASAFLNAFGVPVEIFRTLAVSALAFFVIRTMRVFQVEYVRRLDAANRARFTAQEQATRELTVMFETCRILGTSLDVNRLVRDSLAIIVQKLDPMISGTIYLYDPEDRALVLKSFYARPDNFSFTSLENDCEKRAAQSAFASSEIAYVVEDEIGTSFIAVPLIVQEKPVGALCLAHREAFSNYAVIQTLARQLGIALENAQLYAAVQEKEKLRGELLERTVAAQEEERKRVARELHDETGQWLTALAAGLGGVEETIAQNPQMAQTQVAALKKMTMGAIENLRQFVADLRPSVLDDMGLVPALRWLTHEYHERWHFDADIEVAGIRRRLSPQVETVLFRIAQEALNNVARHAHATRACVCLELKDRMARLVIEDNGAGFASEGVLGLRKDRRAWGLLGMKERAALAGGSLRVESQMGQGTRVTVEIPLMITEGEGVV